jgi:hypothetical protein
VSRDPPPFAEVAPDLQVPPGLEAMIQHGLAKLSGERISSAVDYSSRLDEIARAAGVEIPMVPRASGQLPIPSGPHSMTPSPGFMMTPTPGAYATPPPGGYPTPPPGYSTPPPGYATPPHGVPTPLPVHYGELATSATQALNELPRTARQVSIADVVSSEPLPRAVKVAAGVIVLGAIVVAAVLILGGGGGKSKGGANPVGVPIVNPVDAETRLKAALHDLENGKTCADRKAALPVLAQVGGDRAITALKRARYRMRGGVLGIGDNNTNACLKGDAEKIIQALGGSLR